jgi:hypothetical protein
MRQVNKAQARICRWYNTAMTQASYCHLKHADGSVHGSYLINGCPDCLHHQVLDPGAVTSDHMFYLQRVQEASDDVLLQWVMDTEVLNFRAMLVTELAKRLAARS